MSSNGLGKLLAFVGEVRALGLPYRLSQSRESCITLEVFPLRERWEIDFFEDGTVEVDQFIPVGEPLEVAEIGSLVRRLRDGESSIE
jgi:hypothetical protein